MVVLGLNPPACAATETKESTGQYVDNSVLTAKVKTAIFNEPTLKSSEISVETFKGEVQLSGFVSSIEQTKRAVEVAKRLLQNSFGFENQRVRYCFL